MLVRSILCIAKDNMTHAARLSCADHTRRETILRQSDHRAPIRSLMCSASCS